MLAMMPPCCILYGTEHRSPHHKPSHQNLHHLAIRFVDTYFSAFPGYYDTMDAGVKDEHGYIKVTFAIAKSQGLR